MFLALLVSCTIHPADDGVTRWIVEGTPTQWPAGVSRVRALGAGSFAVRATPEVAAALASWPGVEGIRPEARFEAALELGLDAIGQPIAEAAGLTGAGVDVVLFDTGADPSVFGCAAAGEPGCPLLAVVEIAPDDGVLDDTRHGTIMAEVVHAVAPGAGLYVLDVFDTDGLAWESDLLAARDWVMDHVLTLDQPTIVNLSLTALVGGPECVVWSDWSTLPEGVRPWDPRLLVVGPASDDLAWCPVESLQVGAGYPGDVGPIVTDTCTDATTSYRQEACFSPPWWHLQLAPGVVTTTAGEHLVGMSVATAYAAGASAVAWELDPASGSYDIGNHLYANGATEVWIGDRPVSWTDLGATLANCVDQVSLPYVPFDYDAHSFTFWVDAGERCDWAVSTTADWFTVSPASGVGLTEVTATVTRNDTGAPREAAIDIEHFTWSHTVTQRKGPSGTIRVVPPPAPFTAFATRDVQVELTSPTGVDVCLSTTSSTTCTAWQPLQPTLPATLTWARGRGSVRAWFRDAEGNVGDPTAAVATYDPFRPGDGTVAVFGVDADSVDVTWSGFVESTSGLLDYAVTRAAGATPPACGTTFTPSTLVREDGLTPGATNSWRVCARDKAGNVSFGATATFVGRAEYVPPLGTLDLPVASRTTTVTATLAATDNVAVTEHCLSNTTTCTTWAPYASSVSWNAGGTGVRTVRAWFRDAAGNVAGPVEDTVNVDAVAPSGGTLTAAAEDGAVALAWTGIVETGSGVASYRLARATGTTPPSNCTTTVWTGPETTARIDGLTNGTTYAFRLCAVDAAGNTATGLTASARPAPELVGPTDLSVVLSAGAEWARTTSVTASLAATDPSGVARACVSSSAASCGTWFAMTPTKTVTLGGSGTDRTMYAWFEDPWGNRAGPVSDTIRYDATAPTNPVVTATAGDAEVTLSWTSGTDAASGVAQTRIVQATGTTAPANCNGAAVWTGTTPSATLTSLVNGTTYAFRVCHDDAAGNRSTGATTSARPAPEFDGPQDLSVVLSAGAEWARTTSVTASLAATDASGVARACVSSTSASCASWFAMTPTKTVTLGGSGTERTMYAWFEDTWGNRAGPVSDTIRYDATAPTNPVVTATAGDAEVTLSWTSGTDATSGLVDTRIVQATGTTAPANCNGAPVWSGTATSATLVGLVNGTTYAFRVCHDDAAGNRSTGVTTTSRPAPEFDPPTGAVAVAGGAAWVRTTAVTLDLTGADASGVATACASTSTTCTAFTAFGPARAFTLPSGDGTKTVRVWLRDPWGNTSAPVEDTVGLDATPPTNGTVTATAAPGSASLSWAGFADTRSGVVSYVVVQAPTTAPARCTAGTVAYEGSATAVALALPSGAPTGLRVCAVDAAGNLSTGAVIVATAL